ncbi:MAG TPA: phosphopantetheine-binding protein [Bryobacteraceae bacterium]|nr:phosphopantetheine-binding protein [Bryobacteraceae bacterium]
MADDVMSRVIRVIAETQRVPLDTIKPESTFEELKIDSLDGINIVFAIENEFNVNVPDEAAKSLRSVRDVAEGVEKLVAGG